MNNLSSFVRVLLLQFVLLAFVSGCAKDYSMESSPTGEQVKIAIKVPEELEVTPLRVMYRSAICERVAHDGMEDPRSSKVTTRLM